MDLWIQLLSARYTYNNVGFCGLQHSMNVALFQIMQCFSDRILILARVLQTYQPLRNVVSHLDWMVLQAVYFHPLHFLYIEISNLLSQRFTRNGLPYRKLKLLFQLIQIQWKTRQNWGRMAFKTHVNAYYLSAKFKLGLTLSSWYSERDYLLCHPGCDVSGCFHHGAW